MKIKEKKNEKAVAALIKLLEKIKKKNNRDKVKVKEKVGYNVSEATNRLRVTFIKYISEKLFRLARRYNKSATISASDLKNALPTKEGQPFFIKSIIRIFCVTKKPDLSFEKVKNKIFRLGQFNSPEQVAHAAELATLHYPAVIEQRYNGTVSEEYVRREVIGESQKLHEKK